MSKVNPQAKFVATEDLSVEELDKLPSFKMPLIYRSKPGKDENQRTLLVTLGENLFVEVPITMEDFTVLCIEHRLGRTTPKQELTLPFRLSKGIRGSGYNKGKETFYMIEIVLLKRAIGLEKAYVAKTFLKQAQTLYLLNSLPNLVPSFIDRDI